MNPPYRGTYEVYEDQTILQNIWRMSSSVIAFIGDHQIVGKALIVEFPPYHILGSRHHQFIPIKSLALT